MGRVEREVKLSVWPGFVLPDLEGVVDGGALRNESEQLLDAAYYDTSDLRLLRRGVTLRFRRGEPPGDVWTAKLPAGTPAVGLARRELTLPGRPGAVPEALLDLLRGWALGAPLTQVARLRTARRRVTVSDADSGPQAVLDDDEVSILRGGRVAARFRELEVELLDDAPDRLLTLLAGRLEAAGAQPVDQVPKLVRALGPPALEPWQLDVPPLGERPTAAEVVRAGLLAAAARMVDHFAAAVLDEDPEGVRQARIGLRRLRSDLRTFGVLLDVDRVRPVREELDWLLHSLANVRELDVVLARLRSDASRLRPDDRSGGDELCGRLAEERAAAHGDLLEVLRGDRCAALLERLGDFLDAPPFAADARRPAADVVPALVRSRLRRLRREVERLGPAPADEELHRVRILARRLRYASDVAAPLAGGRVRRATRAVTKLQDVLGEHNDATVALDRLRDLAGDATGGAVWTSGMLGGLQVARAAECRAQFPSAYKAAVAKSRWGWIR